jgi:hypothetical protein
MSYPPLFRIKENGYFGFINSGGEIAVEPQFLEVGEFREGFTHARLNGQWAILDQYGRLYIRACPRAGSTFLGFH